MNSRFKIFIAFFLNLIFSFFELMGGILTGSIAIIADSLHDFGDAISIGVSYFLEKKSTKQANEKYTYGYARYSVLGGVITGLVLLIGSFFVVYRGVSGIINPHIVNYNGMVIFAIVGFCINLVATLLTHGGHSLNQKAVNLHMLEDVLGWLIVLLGAILIKFTNFVIIDPIISIIVAIFIIINAVKILYKACKIFLLKAPKNLNINHLKEHLEEIDGVVQVHHIHVWQIDLEKTLCTMHVVAPLDNWANIKEEIKKVCRHFGICHSTLELESPNEECTAKICDLHNAGDTYSTSCCHHHH